MKEQVSRIPQTDSISELAQFWDTHDLTDFEDELEEVKELVFDPQDQTVVQFRLPPEQATALHKAARSRGMHDADLARQWIEEKLRPS